MDPTIEKLITHSSFSTPSLSRRFKPLSVNDYLKNTTPPQLIPDIQIYSHFTNYQDLPELVNLPKYGQLLALRENFKHPDFEQARRNANPYENLGTSRFINRAAIKLANIIHVFGISQVGSWIGAAEAPGGFAEFLQYKFPMSKGFGISLSVEKGGLAWKLKSSPHFRAYTEGDGSGDLYTQSLLFSNFVKRETRFMGVDLHTADGGFNTDEEADYNRKELLTMRLILSEILIGLITVRVGGAMIIKMFNTHSEISKQLMMLISLAFEDVYLFKPLSSRPANSEKYLVALGKRGDIESLIEIVKNGWYAFNGEGNLSRPILNNSKEISNVEPSISVQIEENLETLTLNTEKTVQLVKLFDYDENSPWVKQLTSWLYDVNTFLIEEQLFYSHKIIDYLNNIPLNYPTIDLYKAFIIWNIPDNPAPVVSHYYQRDLNLPKTVNIISVLPINNLAEEYQRWLDFQHIWTNFLSLGGGNLKKKYNITKVLVRFLLWYFNHPNEYIKARDVALKELWEDKDIKINLDPLTFDLYMSVKSINMGGRNDLNLRREISIYPKSNEVTFLNREAISGQDSIVISYGAFKIKLLPEQVSAMLLKYNNQEHLVQTLLRYNIIRFDTSNFWSAPPSVYQYLINTVKIEYEGFANPIVNHGIKFFSPYPDLDRVYGSLGSFFDTELPAGIYSINPPYVDRLMRETSQKIIETLNNAMDGDYYTFYCFYPDWVNNESLTMLMNSRFLKKSESLANIQIHDLVTEEVFTATFTNRYFWLTNKPSNQEDEMHFYELIRRFY